MAGVRADATTSDLVGRLSSLWYQHRPSAFVDRETFRRDDDAGQRTHHLHVIGANLRTHHDLLFRDRLHRHATLAAEYLALKAKLAEQHADDLDRRAYAAGNTAFIQRGVDAERADRGLETGGCVYSRVR